MSSASELRKLFFTGFFSVLFTVAIVNQLRGDDHSLAWISAIFLVWFLAWFAVTLKMVLGRFRSRRSVDFAAGGLLSVLSEEGDYAVGKILHADSSGVHVRVYAQRFPSRPVSVSATELSVEPYGPEYDNAFSIGHMPLNWVTFADWLPRLISRGASVTEEELEGFRMWQEAEAGYF